MKITFLGHSGFRIEIGDQVLLIDPWLAGNPVFDARNRAEAIKGATAILLTHGHGDHSASAPGISKETGAPVCCIHELSGLMEKKGANVTGFGKGGTLKLGNVAVTLVNAVHSSSIDYGDAGPVYAGGEAGLMIAGEGHVIYVSGDTDVHADMEWLAAYHKPDIGILACGGHYTMDMDRAAWAAKRWFDFKVVIPCHFRTFPLLAQSADSLIAALPGVDVRVLDVMGATQV